MAILCSSRSYRALTNKQSWPAKGHFATFFQVHHNTAWGRSTLKTNTTIKSFWCWKNSLTPWANYCVKQIFHIMSPAWLISTSHSPLGALESNRNMQGSALSPADCFCHRSQKQSPVARLLSNAVSGSLRRRDKTVTNYQLHLPTSQSSWQANHEVTTLVTAPDTHYESNFRTHQRSRTAKPSNWGQPVAITSRHVTSIGVSLTGSTPIEHKPNASRWFYYLVARGFS